MTDAHCHLNFHSFETDYDEVIKRALKAGITRIINAGTSLDSSTKAVEFAEKYPNLYAIVGVHPHHADKLIKSHPEHSEGSSRQDSSASPQNDKNNWLQELEQLTKHPKVIGIGEIGMDYYSYQSNGIVDPKIQREVFEKQIELAYKTGLPFQIHNRHAGIDVIEILTHHKNSFQTVPGMFHCFAGTKEVLKD